MPAVGVRIAAILSMTAVVLVTMLSSRFDNSDAALATVILLVLIGWALSS